MNDVSNNQNILNPSYVIKDIVKTFEEVPTTGAEKFSLRFTGRKDGNSSQYIPLNSTGFFGLDHHQGMYCLGEKNFVIVGSGYKPFRTAYGYLYKFANNTAVFNPDNSKYYEYIDSNFSHPSGIQVVDNILAVGNEQYKMFKTLKDKSKVKFYDLNPSNGGFISELSHLTFERSDRSSAVGLAHLNDQWILAIRGTKKLHFYHLKGDIHDTTKTFTELTSEEMPIESKDDGDSYKLQEFQCINLFWGTEVTKNDPDPEPELFLFGMPYKTSRHDRCSLYRMGTKKDDLDHVTKITGYEHKVYKHFHRNGSGPRFKYASCVYFEPSATSEQETTVSGRFKVYSCSAHADSSSNIYSKSLLSSSSYSISCNEWTGSFID